MAIQTLLFFLGLPLIVIALFAILIGLTNLVLVYDKITGYIFKYDRNDYNNINGFKK